MNDAYQEAADALPEDARWTLRRADGFLDLQMLDRACRELESIPPDVRSNLVCRRVGLRHAVAVKDWSHAAHLAEGLTQACPEDCALWIEWAYAKRRTAGIPAARKILMQAWDRFPQVAVIPYNLACYACREDDLEKTRDLLSRAFALDATYHEVAVEDKDLEPLWAELSE